MKKLRVGINGFGRIGRVASRIILDRDNLELAAINSRAEASSHAYLLKYDSTYGTVDKEIKSEKDSLVINGHSVAVLNSDEPAQIPWAENGVDIVIDATGKFRTSDELKPHLKAGAGYVVLSAPAKDQTKTLVMGVNEKLFDPQKDKIISNSSCTTNCLATTLSVVHGVFGVTHGFMTTTHAVTDSQNLLDNSHKKEVRLRRAAFASLIPASTGSARDINKIIPELSGKITCQAIRVPLLTVSLLNLTVGVSQKVSRDEVNGAFKAAEKNKLTGILSVAGDELVSKDYTGDSHSAVIDPFLTQVTGDKLVNIFAWYDNEWGYTSRLVDMVTFVGRKAGLL